MKVIVFLGPSLPVEEAKALLPNADFRPPARQGDVFRALEEQPGIIALIDGVFEAQPSVWHHELLAALDAGVIVLGASSMGALRAAELHSFGMIGVGEIFKAYREGTFLDDAEVALLHADAQHASRPFTVPLVNVRHAAERAVRARALSDAEAKALIETAQQVFYQDRSWRRLLDEEAWPAERRTKFERWLQKARPDLKAADARLCLKEAAKLQRRGKRRPVATRPRVPSALVRRRRLAAHEDVLEGLRNRPDADELIESGLSRLLLAQWARMRGLKIPADVLDREVRAAEKRVDLTGLDDAQLRLMVEDVLLAQQVITHAERMVPDGPSSDEALAFEARLRGLWPTARPSRGRAARSPPSPRGGGPARRRGRATR